MAHPSHLGRSFLDALLESPLADPYNKAPTKIIWAEKKEQGTFYPEIYTVILQLMIKFRHEKGYTPDPPELAAFINQDGLFRVTSESLLAKYVTDIKNEYLKKKAKSSWRVKLVFRSHVQERIFEMSNMLWDDEAKLNQDGVRELIQVRVDPILGTRQVIHQEATFIKRGVLGNGITVGDNTWVVENLDVQNNLVISVLTGILEYGDQPEGISLYEFLRGRITEISENDQQYSRPYIAAMILWLQFRFMFMNEVEHHYVPGLETSEYRMMYDLCKKIWGDLAGQTDPTNASPQEPGGHIIGLSDQDEEDTVREFIAFDFLRLAGVSSVRGKLKF
ncbi:OLC1v1003288C1 [Oldenlandia corymbosa var. corymbosa]|uniref:OLC1v1003288C1 n=1 Tax=Oldenlandia corymbosa var. corymbosa TaxID=529605 RepID=A0AAV1D9N9_OLDCO|nr:OLC1v1003288C1 [Oldenlandia corymbosa var. corymbosa]